MNTVYDGQKQYSCSAERLRELYEQLRDYVLNTLDTPAPVYGLGVMVLRGMPAWIKAASHYANGESCSDNKGPQSIRLQPCDTDQLREIPADTLIHHCHKEVSR